MSDYISEKSLAVNEARNKAIVSLKKYSRPKFVSAMLELVIASVMMFGAGLIWCTFDLKKIYSWGFWVSLFTMTVAIFMLYRAIINARFPKTATRENVVKVRDEYNEKNKIKDLPMREWLKNVFNVKTKTEAYIDQQNKKLIKLEKKMYRTTDPVKRDYIEEQMELVKASMEDKYITQHIDRIHIKYYIVSYGDFTHEDATMGSRFVTRSNYDRAFNIASFNKMWAFMLSTIIMGVSIFEARNMGTLAIITNIVSTSFIIVARIVMALLDADKIYDSTITASLYGRIQVLDEYKVYKDQHPTITEKQKFILEADRRATEKAEAEYKDKLEEELIKYKEQMRLEFEKQLSVQ